MLVATKRARRVRVRVHVRVHAHVHVLVHVHVHVHVLLRFEDHGRFLLPHVFLLTQSEIAT